MKIKINKEQIVYLNSLESPEAKKEFLMDCFIDQFEATLEKETIDYIDSSDKIKQPTATDYIDGTNSNYSAKEKFDKFIKDNGLKKFTPPEKKSFGYKVVYIPTNWKFLADPIPIHPDKVKKYTKEDLENAFNAATADIMGLPVFNNFEEYLKAITP